MRPSFDGMIRTALCIGLALAVACTAAARAETAIRFSLNGRFEGPVAPFLLAIDRGYDKAQNLAVTIEPASSATEPIERVASGAFDMAMADINAVIRNRDKNPGDPVLTIFIIYNKPPYSIIARKSRGIAVPKDLEGKKLGAPPGDNSFSLWKLFADTNGIDASKVTIESVGAAVREPMLAAGQLDAMTGLSFSAYVNLKNRGVPADDLLVMLMADYGLNLYGDALIVNAKFAAQHREAVTGFLHAYLRALKDTIKDPSAAIDAVLKRNELAGKDVELERLRMALRENLLTPEVKANGFGTVDPARLARSIKQLAESFAFKSKPAADDVFDASFLPPAAERKVH